MIWFLSKCVIELTSWMCNSDSWVSLKVIKLSATLFKSNVD